MTEVYLALGSNLGNRRRLINEAVKMIQGLPRTKVLAVSKLIATDPSGGPECQPRYLNACLKVQTALSAADLLKHIHRIETALGRKRTVRNAPRTIDIDILLFGMTSMRTKHLVIPHPRMFERRFVMQPLAEVLNLTV